MMEYRVETHIAAPPLTVWELLTDEDAWAATDNGVVRLEGRIDDGGTVKVFSEVSPDRAFPVRVALDPPRRMTWTGGMPLGLFRGVRTFALEPAGDGTTFTMHEEFTGPLLGLMRRQMPDLQPSFDHFARGLQEAAEARG